MYRKKTHPDLAELELVVSSSRIEARGDTSGLATIVVILQRIVDRVSIALAQVESRIEKALSRIDGESRNNAEELHKENMSCFATPVMKYGIWKYSHIKEHESYQFGQSCDHESKVRTGMSIQNSRRDRQLVRLPARYKF